jgi:shikimate dehydrogenase
MISGHTKILAHLGVPTGSFKAPLIYNPWFEARGIDTVVVPMGCEAEDFPEFLRLVFRLRNIAGALITMPHKVTTVGLLDECSPAVRICGACNAVRRDDQGRLIGDMFDGEGFVRGMIGKGRSPKGASALVVGAGGVGSAIAAALAGHGIARLALYDTRPGTVERLAGRIRAHYPTVAISEGTASTGGPNPSGFDIVVNATPLGMNDGDPLPMPTDAIDPSSFVGEVVMTREETPFLAAAKAKGCTVQFGVDMLFEQIPAYLEFFGYPETSAQELREVADIRY